MDSPVGFQCFRVAELGLRQALALGHGYHQAAPILLSVDDNALRPATPECTLAIQIWLMMTPRPSTMTCYSHRTNGAPQKACKSAAISNLQWPCILQEYV